MSWLDGTRARLRLLFSRGAVEERVREEFAFHIEMETERLVREEGLDRAEAHRRARIAFGGVEKHKEEIRDGRGLRELRAIGRSFASAWRSLNRRPGYFTIAVSSLAVALGLATTVIAQIDSLRHPFTPIAHADRVFVLVPEGHGPRGAPPMSDVRAAFTSSGVFERVVQIDYISRRLSFAGISRPHFATLAGPDYFALLGAKPRMGRLFAPDETFESGVAIVGSNFWREHFGDATKLDGATVTFDDRPFQVIGVLDAGWDDNPHEAHLGDAWQPPDQGIWAPPPVGELLYRNSVYVTRLAKETTSENAGAVVSALAARWRGQYGTGRSPFFIRMWTMQPDPLGLRSFHQAMLAAALFILLIACANVSALILARGVANRRSQALRLAIGASRGDLVRDVLTESAIIAAGGAVIGLGITYASMHIMMAATPVDLAWLGFSRPNWSPRVFAGLFAAVVASVGIAAAGPAWLIANIAPVEPLKDESGTTTGRSRSRFQMLIVGELALAMILLFGASLISKTAHRVATFDFGYDALRITRLQTIASLVPHLSPPVTDKNGHTWMKPEVTTASLAAIAEHIRRSPSVRDAAWYSEDQPERSVVVSEATAALDSVIRTPILYNTGPGFFRTLGIPVVEGRDFVEGDAERGALILDQQAAQRLFPHGTAVGKTVKLGPFKSNAQWLPVVGVARNASLRLPIFPGLPPEPVIYVSRNDTKGYMPKFAVRGKTGMPDVAGAAAEIATDLLPRGGSAWPSKWAGDYESIVAGRRFTAELFITLSLASLVLAVAGLFGVLSYSVNRRMREFSLRVALGANRTHMLRLVFRESFVMVLGGTAVGAFVGMYAAFEIDNWLWGVYPVDAAALVIAEGVLIAFAVATSLIPALRAARANPAEVMRAI